MTWHTVVASADEFQRLLGAVRLRLPLPQAASSASRATVTN